MFRRSSFNFFDFVNDRNFSAKYRCFSVSRFQGADRSDLDRGGKLLLPPKALEALTKYHLSSPMLFQLRNAQSNRSSHAGVLEFIAEDGKCYLPDWLMKNLNLKDNDTIDIESVTLPTATFSKFQPMSVDFLDITNPKAVLENALRNFACLTKNDIIAIHYNRKVYELLVLETKPRDAVSIIECDMNVEFSAPVGYEDEKEAKEAIEKQVVEDIDDFAGEGQRLDGKKKKDIADHVDKKVKKKIIGIPYLSYDFTILEFNHQIIPISDRKDAKSTNLRNEQDEDEPNNDDGFYGKGSTL